MKTAILRRFMDCPEKAPGSGSLFCGGKLPGDQPGPGEAHDLRRPHRSQPHLSPTQDMSKIASKEDFQKEAHQPGGKIEISGRHAKILPAAPENTAWKTFRWQRTWATSPSFGAAYVDWYQDRQPSKEEAFKKLLGRIHPGAHCPSPQYLLHQRRHP